MNTFAEHRPLSHEEYHTNRTHDSSSTLRIFRRSPAEYYHRYVTERIPADPPTDAMRLGTAVHAAILEPERIDDVLALIPDDVLSANGSKAGGAYKDWVATIGARLPIKAAEYHLVRWQVECVRENREVARMLDSATVREHSIFFRHQRDRPMRCRLDGASELDAVVFDIKRTRQTAATFWRAVRDYGYHRQAAIYCDGFQALYGVRPEFWFVLVCDDPPFESCTRRLPAEAIDVGRREVAETIEHLSACQRGDRPWMLAGYDERRDLELPEWFYNGGHGNV